MIDIENMRPINRPPYTYCSGKWRRLSYYVRRFTAFLYDYIIASIIITCILLIYISITGLPIWNVTTGLLVYGIALPTIFVYNTLFEWALEATPGKILVSYFFNVHPIVGVLWVAFAPTYLITLLLIQPPLHIFSTVVATYFVVCFILTILTKKTDTPPKSLIVISKNKRRITFSQAAIRNIGKILPLISPIMFFVDVLMIFITKTKQRLFDIVAGTCVMPAEAFQFFEQG